MGKSSRGKRDDEARAAKQRERLAKQAARQDAARHGSGRHSSFDDSPVRDAHHILAELDAATVSHRFAYYAIEPEQLSGDLDVPVDGEMHVHEVPIGKTLHLNESARHASATEASRGFTAPFIAVIRRADDASSPVEHATVVQGVDMSSDMIMGPLQVIMIAHRLPRLHFAGLLGMSTIEDEWTPAGRDEMQQIIADFQLRVEAEAVIVAGGHMADLER